MSVELAVERDEPEEEDELEDAEEDLEDRAIAAEGLKFVYFPNGSWGLVVH